MSYAIMGFNSKAAKLLPSGQILIFFVKHWVKRSQELKQIARLRSISGIMYYFSFHPSPINGVSLIGIARKTDSRI